MSPPRACCRRVSLSEVQDPNHQQHRLRLYGWRSCALRARTAPPSGRYLHTYLFRSPEGYLYLVTNQGTLPPGRTGFAETVWRAATELSADAA